MIFLEVSHFRAGCVSFSYLEVLLGSRVMDYLKDIYFLPFASMSIIVILVIFSVHNGLGAQAASGGNCQEDWTRPDNNFYSVPSWDILGLQV